MASVERECLYRVSPVNGNASTFPAPFPVKQEAGVEVYGSNRPLASNAGRDSPATPAWVFRLLILVPSLWVILPHLSKVRVLFKPESDNLGSLGKMNRWNQNLGLLRLRQLMNTGKGRGAKPGNHSSLVVAGLNLHSSVHVTLYLAVGKNYGDKAGII